MPLYSSVKKGQVETIEAESLTRELLETSKCYLLDCGVEVFVWMGKATSLDERKSASKVAEVRNIVYSVPLKLCSNLFLRLTFKDLMFPELLNRTILAALIGHQSAT